MTELGLMTQTGSDESGSSVMNWGERKGHSLKTPTQGGEECDWVEPKLPRTPVMGVFRNELSLPASSVPGTLPGLPWASAQTTGRDGPTAWLSRIWEAAPRGSTRGQA